MTDELDETEALAAEYVLGTLDHAARRRVEEMARTDPELARLVNVWQQRLAPLAEAIQPVEPPPQVWAGIQRALTEEQPTPAVRPTLAPRRRLSESLAVWRWSTFGASALAAALALFIALTPSAPPATRYVAVLNRGDASPALIVTVDAAAGRMTIRPLETAPVEDRVMELWLVAGADTPPYSLGLLDPAQEIAFELDPQAEAVFGRSATLAVSLEPPGGSPTGLPTGPVVYQGPLLSLAE